MFSRVRKITRIYPCQKTSYSFSTFIFSISAFAFLLVLPCFGLTLKELETSYESKCSEIRLEKSTALESLRESYLGALSRIEAKYQRAGRLDEVLLVKQEAASIEKAQWPLKALPRAISLETSAPRKIYLKKHIEIEQQAAKDLAGTADTMEKALDHQVADLTKSGDLAEAKLAQQIKAEITKDPQITSARQLLKNVRTDGSSRPALRIRRAGDNIEVLVHYDMRGKIGPESPVSNVKEDSKEIGDTQASNLGEFIGAEGYETDSAIIFDETFDGKELVFPNFILGRFKISQSETAKEESGMKIQIDLAQTNWHGSLPGILTPADSPSTVKITARYYVPRNNKHILGFYFNGEIGGPFPGNDFEQQGKWTENSVTGSSVGPTGNILFYLKFSDSVDLQKASEEYVVLGALRIDRIKFSAYLVERYDRDRSVSESENDPAKQAVFARNGNLVN